jgi:hypothetical protein
MRGDFIPTQFKWKVKMNNFPQNRQIARRRLNQTRDRSYDYTWSKPSGLNQNREFGEETKPCDIDIQPFVFTKERGFEPNYERKYKQTPFILTFDEDALNNSSILQVAANSKDTAQLSNDREGVLKLNSLSKESTSNDFLINIFSTFHQYNLMNQPVHAETIFGRDGKVFELCRPLVLDRLGNLRISVTDLSGSQNDVSLVFSGEKYYRDDEIYIFRSELERFTYPYFYTTDNEIVLPANNSEQTAFVTIRNYPFFLNNISQFSDGLYEFKIFYNSGQRQITNGFVPSSVLGNGEFNLMFKDDLIEHENVLKIVFRNLSGAQNRVFLTFSGYEWRGHVNN